MLRRHRPVRGTAIVLALGVSACMKWSTVAVPPAPAPLHTYPGLTRVTTRDNESMELHNVVTISDSLFGLGGDVARLRVALPLSSVARIEERVKSPGRTLIAIGIGLVALSFTGALGVGFK